MITQINTPFACRFKQNVWSSRVNTTAALVRAISMADIKPDVFVNVSGVSIYPADGETYSEDSPAVPPQDYMAKLCHRWEEAANLNDSITTRLVLN